jgi:hypothetical protein
VDLHRVVGGGPGDARGGSGRSDQDKRDEARALLAPSRSTPRASSSKTWPGLKSGQNCTDSLFR